MTPKTIRPEPYEDCDRCLVYAIIRQPVLVPALNARRTVTGESSQEITDRYMGGVHARHLAGHPINPSAVKR